MDSMMGIVKPARCALGMLPPQCHQRRRAHIAGRRGRCNIMAAARESGAATPSDDIRNQQPDLQHSNAAASDADASTVDTHWNNASDTEIMEPMPWDAEPAAAMHESRAAGSESQIGVAASITHPPPEPPEMSLLASPSGFVWSLALLFTIRLSRRSTETSLFMLRNQEVSEEELINDQKLFSKRRAFEQQQAVERAAEAENRLLKARQEAGVREAQKLQRERERAEAAAAAKAKAEAAAQARRKAFEEEEALSAAQLAEKTEAARRAREEQDRILREQREQARREEEERQRQKEVERRAQEAEEARKAAEARAAKEAERRALAKLATRFAVRLEGSANIAKPQTGAKTEGRLPRDALVQLGVSLGSAVGGAPQQHARVFASLPDAHAGCTALAGEAARAATDQFVSAVRLQAMMGEGPLQRMDDVELQHWMHVAACRTVATTTPVLHALLEDCSLKIAATERPLQVRTERLVLPRDHQQRFSSRMDHAISSIEAGRLEQALVTLADVTEEEERSLTADMAVPLPPHMAAILLLAHLLDRTLDQRPARTADAPAWFEATAALIRQQLKELTKEAAKDTLGPTADMTEACLGSSHPVAGMVREVADTNMSAAALAAQREKQRLMEAEIAAALVEEEWPDEAELAAQRAADREAQTPIPERVWALRNVAATSALGGPASRARAVQLLQKAVELKEQWVQSDEHPSLLPELHALANVLASSEDWRQEEIITRERALRILSFVAARYRSSGHPASAVALLEAAVREHEQGLGLRHRGVTTLTKRAEAWFEELPPDVRLKVAETRRNSDVVKAVVASFEEELAANQGVGTQRFTKAQLWDQGGLAPLPLIVH